jgi:hypothetical protein
MKWTAVKDAPMVLEGEFLVVYHPCLFIPHYEERGIQFGAGAATDASAVVHVRYQGVMRFPFSIGDLI